MVDTQHACEIRRQQVQKPTRPGLEQVSDHAIAKAKAHGVMDVTVRLYSQAMYNPSVRPVYVTVILQTPPSPADAQRRAARRLPRRHLRPVLPG